MNLPPSSSYKDVAKFKLPFVGCGAEPFVHYEISFNLTVLSPGIDPAFPGTLLDGRLGWSIAVNHGINLL